MVYTKTGDKGTTSLVGGKRVSKCDPRVEAYGTVDELNSHVGLLAEYANSIDPAIYTQMKSIQDDLFTIQTLLATEDEALYAKMPQVSEYDIKKLEQWIDTTEASLPKLRSFVTAGGSVAGAQAHVARCVCRRAERRVVEMSQQCNVEPVLMQYLNRLSDYLFVISRKLVVSEGKEETFKKI
ncbi:MAG: cob(I)yrinic acid a,c-diamide adenosyltransferase [Bacteroidales bacterium]|nr:cob(I)yrinic acid a,c-diamide adenosyltransferase [Bacteroidales bacterium]